MVGVVCLVWFLILFWCIVVLENVSLRSLVGVCERERDCGDDYLFIGFMMMGFFMFVFLFLIEEFGGVGFGVGVVGVLVGGWVNCRRGSC